MCLLSDYIHHFSAKQSLPVAMENHENVRFLYQYVVSAALQYSGVVFGIFLNFSVIEIKEFLFSVTELWAWSSAF